MSTSHRLTLLFSLITCWGCADEGTQSADASDAYQGDSSASTPDAGITDAAMSGDTDAAGLLQYQPCDLSNRLGGIEVTLDEGFTSVQGQIYNGVVPAYIPMVTQTDGLCRLLRPRGLRCEPRCEVGTTCGEDGQCQPQPEAVSVGDVTITGLTAPVELNAGPPVFFYSHRGDLPHPAFGPGDPIGFAASGDGAVMSFNLRGQGIEPLVIQSAPLDVSMGNPATVRWTSPTGDTEAKIHLVLSIANHGGTPGQIDCEVPDVGEFTFPVSLTDALLNLGYSGFPAVWLTRRTVDSTTTSLGCVEFIVQSKATLDISIPGLTSCSDDTDCPDGQTCGPDLACGASAPGE